MHVSLLDLAAQPRVNATRLLDVFGFYASRGRGMIARVTIPLIARVELAAEQRAELLRLAKQGDEAVRQFRVSSHSPLTGPTDYQKVAEYLEASGR